MHVGPPRVRFRLPRAWLRARPDTRFRAAVIRLKFLAMVVSSTIGGKNVDRHEYGHRQMNGNKRAFHYQHSGRTQHKDQRQRDKKIEQGPPLPPSVCHRPVGTHKGHRSSHKPAHEALFKTKGDNLPQALDTVNSLGMDFRQQSSRPDTLLVPPAFSARKER